MTLYDKINCIFGYDVYRNDVNRNVCVGMKMHASVIFSNKI